MILIRENGEDRQSNRAEHEALVSKKTKYADVAQLAEQLTCNQQVIGSSPIIGFNNGWQITLLYVI